MRIEALTGEGKFPVYGKFPGCGSFPGYGKFRGYGRPGIKLCMNPSINSGSGNFSRMWKFPWIWKQTPLTV